MTECSRLFARRQQGPDQHPESGERQRRDWRGADRLGLRWSRMEVISIADHRLRNRIGTATRPNSVDSLRANRIRTALIAVATVAGLVSTACSTHGNAPSAGASPTASPTASVT